MITLDELYSKIDRLIWACWFLYVITPREAAQEIEWLLMRGAIPI
ncbi:MAG: hypothetical protein PVJ86_03990 [Phycisphaerales bacterium]|jgi:hypothetical protein